MPEKKTPPTPSQPKPSQTPTTHKPFSDKGLPPVGETRPMPPVKPPKK